MCTQWALIMWQLHHSLKLNQDLRSRKRSLPNSSDTRHGSMNATHCNKTSGLHVVETQSGSHWTEALTSVRGVSRGGSTFSSCLCVLGTALPNLLQTSYKTRSTITSTCSGPASQAEQRTRGCKSSLAKKLSCFSKSHSIQDVGDLPQ